MPKISFTIINGCCMLTDNHNAFLDKVFKVQERTKSSCQPIETLAAPQTPNLPLVETKNKSPQLTNKKKRSRKFSKPAQKRCKRGLLTAVVRAGERSGIPDTVNSGIKSAWSATALLTISSVYNAVATPPLSNAIQDQQHTSNLKALPVGIYMMCVLCFLFF